MDEDVLLEDHASNSKMIRITRPMRIKWDLLTMILALWNALWVPIDIAFVKQGELAEFTLILSTIIDTFFITDLFLNFYTTYVDRSGEEVFDHKKIVRHYLKTWFVFDLIASFPLDKVLILAEYDATFGNQYL